MAERRHFRRFHDDSICQIPEVHPVSPRVVRRSREASAALTRTAVWVHEVSRLHMRARSPLITVEEELFSGAYRKTSVGIQLMLLLLLLMQNGEMTKSNTSRHGL